MSDSVFKCDICGKIVSEDDLELLSEKYPIGDTYIIQEYKNYECNCGGSLEEAIACDICGEWFLPEELHGYRCCVCDKCLNENLNLDLIIDNSKKQDKVDVKINPLLAYVYDNTSIERMLMNDLIKSIESKALKHNPHADSIVDAIYEYTWEDVDDTADMVIHNERRRENNA